LHSARTTCRPRKPEPPNTVTMLPVMQYLAEKGRSAIASNQGGIDQNRPGKSMRRGGGARVRRQGACHSFGFTSELAPREKRPSQTCR
jgi:hypothetical protein